MIDYLAARGVSLYGARYYAIEKISADGSTIAGAAAYGSGPVRAFRITGLDFIAPKSTIALSPSASAAGWHKGTVTATITAGDNDRGTGVKEIHYTVDMGTEQVVSGNAASFEVTGEGTHTVAYWAVDNEGNIETTNYAAVKIDLTLPGSAAVVVPTPNAAGWNKAGARVDATATDAGGSGVNEIRYTIDNGSEEVVAGASASIAIATAGVHTIVTWAVDQAGNKSPAITTTVRMDTKAPVATAVLLNRELTLSGEDELSGVARLVYSVDGGSEQTYTAPLQLPLTARFVRYWAVDIAGNVSSPETKVVGQFFKAITIAPSTVYAGSAFTAKVELLAPAPAGGVVLNLESSKSSVVAVPATISIPAGATSATVSLVPAGVDTDTDVRIEASYLDAHVSGWVGVLVPTPKTLSVSPNVVVGGAASTATVTLVSKAPPGGQVVLLRSLEPSIAQIPASMTIPAGAVSAKVTITTSNVPTDRTVLIVAETDGVVALASLTVRSVGPAKLVLSPTTVVGGGQSKATITLNRPAPPGGLVVNIVSSNPAAQVPATVTVPAGKMSESFVVNTGAVSREQGALIQLRTPGYAARASLTIQPARLSGLLIAPDRSKGGTTVNGVVVLTGPAPAGGMVVTLRTQSDKVNLPATVVVPAGATSGTFAIRSSPVIVNTTVSVTGYLNLDSRSGTLVLTP